MNHALATYYCQYIIIRFGFFLLFIYFQRGLLIWALCLYVLFSALHIKTVVEEATFDLTKLQSTLERVRKLEKCNATNIKEVADKVDKTGAFYVNFTQEQCEEVKRNVGGLKRNKATVCDQEVKFVGEYDKLVGEYTSQVPRKRWDEKFKKIHGNWKGTTKDREKKMKEKGKNSTLLK